MDDHNGQDIPADVPLPAAAERALADLRDRYGRCYQFAAFWCEGTVRFTATRREDDDLSPFLDTASAEELLGQIRAEYVRRHGADDAAGLDEGTPLPDERPVDRHQLERLQHAYPAWVIRQEGEQRFTAIPRGDGAHPLEARSLPELRCLIAGEAWKPLTGRNPGLPPLERT